MGWKRVTLGEVSSNIQTGPFGSQLHQSDYSESGTPVVMPKDLINGKISESSIARVEEQHVNRLSRHIIENGDILYSRRGDVGRCAFATEKEAGWLCGTGCLRVTVNPNKADNRFVFFQLQQPETVGWVEKHAVGSTMLNLNTSILSNVPISLPDINTQRRIADILSAYDDLIENNRKQIKLLEEAAQRLYKEWFVDLRFPGWEMTEIVDGVPMGWKTSSINELGHFVRGKPITKSNVNEGDVPVVAGGIEPAYYHNVSNTEMPVITISGSGANAGFTKIYFQKIWASDCSYVDSTGTQYIYFVYCFLKNSGDAIKKLQKGSAQPHVYAKDINALTVTIPNMKTLRSFESHIRPCFNAIANCNKIIMSATEARDRLLPRLMSGELEV